MTDRVLRALDCRWVDVLGHPTGRRLLQREGLRLRMDDVIAHAVSRGVALEINSQIERLDLNDSHVRLALDKGARSWCRPTPTSSARSSGWNGASGWRGAAGRRPDDILNTRSLAELRPLLRRHRHRGAA